MKVKGSVCASCYAGVGFYRMTAAKKLRADNLRITRKAIASAPHRAQWVADLVHLIKSESRTVFRWHDSGDILNAQHLSMILAVCRATPEVKHWLPTREYQIAQDVAYDEGIPENVNIRLSAHLIGKTFTPAAPFTSSSVGAPNGKACPATTDPAHKGKCLDCRACWDRATPQVNYALH